MAGEILTELNRIDGNIDAAFEKCRALGATMPQVQNSDYLPETIESIPSASDIPVKTASDMTVSGATVTAPSGWYKSNASKSVATATQATPSISVSSGGLITASATQSAGYVAAGTKSGTKQLTTQAAKTVTPTTSEQTAVAAGVYTTGAVKVAKIPNSYIQPSGTKSITVNGTHDVKLYASVNVNVAGSGSSSNLQTREVVIQNDAAAGGVTYCLMQYIDGNLVTSQGECGAWNTMTFENVLCNGLLYMEFNADFERSIPDDFTLIREAADDASDRVILLYNVGTSTATATLYFSTAYCCFASGTPILTSFDGNSTPIEDIEVGDTIVSYDVVTCENKLVEVSRVIVKENTTDIAEVTFDDGSTITMNAYHPLYCKDGFKSITRYKGYEELIVGDVVKSYDSWKTITNINRYTSDPIVTYNLDVRDLGEYPDVDTNDTYYANGVVVKNGFC